MLEKHVLHVDLFARILSKIYGLTRAANFDKFVAFNVLLWLCLNLRQAKLEKNEIGVKQADPDVVTWPKADRKCQCHLAQAERLVRFCWLQRAPAPRLNYKQG